MRTQRPWTRKNARQDCRRADKARTRFALAVEQCEERTLLSGLGFLQGVVFQDVSLNGQLGGSNTPLAGAKVTLFNATNTQVGSPVTTGSDGSYLFTGLTPGTYKLVETPPSGFANETTQTNSPLNPVQSTTSNSITVNVLDPTQLSVTFNSADEFALPYGGVSFDYFNNPDVSSIGQLPITVNGTGLTSPAQFDTYCVDLNDDLNVGVNTFKVIGAPAAGSAVDANGHAGEIGYLFNHYANASLTPAQAQGLQIAIWKLEYDTTANATNFSAGNIANFTNILPYTTPTQLTADLAAATSFITESFAHPGEPVTFLNAADANPGQTQGLQGLLAGGELNFADVPTDTIKGTKFLNVSGNGLGCNNSPLPGDTPLSGVTINLYATAANAAAGTNPIASTTTDSNGNYSFTGLTPGTYYVGEGATPGYVQTGPSSSTYYTVKLTSPSQTVSNDNFSNFQLSTCSVQNVCFKVVSPSGCTTYTTDLNGHTQQGDTVTVTFTVPRTRPVRPSRSSPTRRPTTSSTPTTPRSNRSTTIRPRPTTPATTRNKSRSRSTSRTATTRSTSSAAT